MRRTTRTRLTLLILTAVLLVTGLASASDRHAPQPRMQLALTALEEAERQLELASADKGGHRADALRHVRQAKQAVRKGIRFDRQH